MLSMLFSVIITKISYENGIVIENKWCKRNIGIIISGIKWLKELLLNTLSNYTTHNATAAILINKIRFGLLYFICFLLCTQGGDF